MDTAKWPTCDKCGHYKVDLRPFYSHEELCQYYIFRDREAPARGLHSIAGDGRLINDLEAREKLLPILQACAIEYISFQIYGLAGRGWDIFVPEHVAIAIKIFDQHGEYAELGLEEFIKRMGNAD